LQEDQLLAVRRSWLVCSCLVLALAGYGCGDDDPDSPTSPTTGTPPPTTTPPPVTTPPPAPATFTVSGVVSESFPTTDVRLEGARVSLTSSTATTTNSRGEFTFTNVAAGSYELRAEKGGYDDQVRSVTLSDAGATVTFALRPKEETIERTSTDRLGQDDPNCSGSSKPCRRYDFGVHHDGEVTADLSWVSSDADLDIELRCDSQVVATAAESKGNTINESLVAEVRAGQRCELRVVHQSGPEQSFVLDWTRPN
jgi:hypothetical protein